MTDPSVVLAAAVSKPYIIKIIDFTLKPLVLTGRWVADPLIDQFSNRFSEYLTRQYLKHSFLPTIVFQVRRPLEDLYIPLTLEAQSTIHQTVEKKSYKIDGFHNDFIPKLSRVLIIDDAGMGKSTLTRFLMMQATKTLVVPVFIELRHLNASRSIIDLLLSELNPVGLDASELKIDKRNLIRLLNKGIFTFFLDGYDEISLKDREKVTLDIKQLTETYSNNKYLITSRPENALAAFPAFHAFTIKPLKRAEAFSLIRKYDNDGERSKRLIERLVDKSLTGVQEFLQNPLLTTLLFRAYDYKNQIPLKKPVFYRQVYDALYEWHDLTKDGYSTREKTSGLDIDSLHKILRGIGFISTLKGKVETDTDGILQWIRDARTYAPELKFSESDFLEDVIKAVPIFRREGNSVLWSHKSLAEYFAAQFVVNDSKLDQENICKHIVNLKKLPSYSNLLDLIYDTDITVFNQNFTRPLISMYKSYVLKLADIHPSIPLSHIEQRAAVSFGRKFIYYGESSSEKNDHHRKLINTVNKYKREATLKWYPNEVLDDFDQSDYMNIKITHLINRQNEDGKSINTRYIEFTHPIMTIFDVLLDKKSPLLLSKAFYLPKAKNMRILGLRNSSLVHIDNETQSIWNNKKNFDSTTRILFDAAPGVINIERVESILRDIDQRTGSSKTTSELLSSLAK